MSLLCAVRKEPAVDSNSTLPTVTHFRTRLVFRVRCILFYSLATKYHEPAFVNGCVIFIMAFMRLVICRFFVLYIVFDDRTWHVPSVAKIIREDVTAGDDAEGHY